MAWKAWLVLQLLLGLLNKKKLKKSVFNFRNIMLRENDTFKDYSYLLEFCYTKLQKVTELYSVNMMIARKKIKVDDVQKRK